MHYVELMKIQLVQTKSLYPSRYPEFMYIHKKEEEEEEEDSVM